MSATPRVRYPIDRSTDLVPDHVIWWAAEECERQRSGEISVPWMVSGWRYACARDGKPTVRDILELGRHVERRKAASGFRMVNVRVGLTPIKVKSEQVPNLIEKLVTAAPRLHPDEWYREYEEIHPFADGNGRTGSILWNWLRGTLENPEAPPDFWSNELDDDHWGSWPLLRPEVR